MQRSEREKHGIGENTIVAIPNKRLLLKRKGHLPLTPTLLEATFHAQLGSDQETLWLAFPISDDAHQAKRDRESNTTPSLLNQPNVGV